ncbi:hypothetical protein ACIO93_35805 [Streptomyces sp. NPDC087903]|uniref:hypothetical protein n=1 Tax=Streptomyces sp. NPDC087903 TaxID=3365819 RepID=UPI00380661B1
MRGTPYEPWAACVLGETLTIGLLLGDLTNSFYASLAKAAVEVMADAGYVVLLSTADEDPEVERRVVGELIGRRVAGPIIVPDQGDHAFLREVNGCDQVPVVFVAARHRSRG